jgi:hypothetical protein
MSKMNTPHREQSGRDREQSGRETHQGTSELKEKGQQAASGVAEKMKDMGNSAMETAKETAASVAGTVGDWASTAGTKVEDAVSAVGSGMESLSGTIRQNAPREGVLGTAACSVADTLESGGRFLRQEGLSGAADEITSLIRRNPIPAVLIGIGIGFLLSRATRS